MILKFDHMAYSCTKNNFGDTFERFSKYRQLFYDHNLPNLDIKRPLMKGWCDTHDISLLNCDGSVPIEITAYDTVHPGGKYEINGNTIIVNTRSLEESIKFYQSIGFKFDGDVSCKLKPVMDNEAITLVFQLVNVDIDYALNSLGYCCLAFITNDVNKERLKIKGKMIEVTEVMSLCVNEQPLDIFFAYNEYGDICEFISLKREKIQ